MKMEKPLKVVRISWIDSCASHSEWELLEDLDKVEPIYIYSYGVVIQEDDKVITIAQNYGSEPNQACCFMTIPKGCILQIDKIDEI